MKTTGIVRGIDSLGRIVLPKELRTNMHIDKDSKLEIFVEGDQIILKKHRPAGSCDFCGELAADMAQYEGYCICPACQDRCTVNGKGESHESDDRLHPALLRTGPDAPCIPLCAGG